MLEFHDKKFSETKYIPILSLLFVLLITAHPVQIQAATEVEITYTGNEGFLIVAEEKIDVAFVPYWHFIGNKFKPALQEGIGAKHVVPMHLILVDGGPQERGRILESISTEFPYAILFSEEMEKRIIQ